MNVPVYLTPSTQLYQPLRNTLDKSIVQSPQLQLKKSRAYQRVGATSRISRRLRSLSPQQATFIKSSTILPINKDLVPTDHLWRVRGKQFSAVNIQVRQGPPIPASAIRIQPGWRGGQVTTQTVYQARPRGSVQNLANTRSITNLRTVFPPQTLNRVSQVTVRPSMSSLDIRRPASPVRVSTVSRIPAFKVQNQYQVNQQPVRFINNNANSRSQISTQRSIKQLQNPSRNQTVNINTTNANQPIQNYDDYEMRPLLNQNKQKYRYNLFSALDQAINTKCGSCGPNQLIASKPLSSWQ